LASGVSANSWLPPQRSIFKARVNGADAAALNTRARARAASTWFRILCRGGENNSRARLVLARRAKLKNTAPRLPLPAAERGGDLSERDPYAVLDIRFNTDSSQPSVSKPREPFRKSRVSRGESAAISWEARGIVKYRA